MNILRIQNDSDVCRAVGFARASGAIESNCPVDVEIISNFFRNFHDEGDEGVSTLFMGSSLQGVSKKTSTFFEPS